MGYIPLNSFKKDTMSKMTFESFVEKMDENQAGYTLREEQTSTEKALRDDIIQPKFVEEINDLAGITLYQGLSFNNPPKYERFE